jgi:hypothetical protein
VCGGERGRGGGWEWREGRERRVEATQKIFDRLGLLFTIYASLNIINKSKCKTHKTKRDFVFVFVLFKKKGTQSQTKMG